jgi:S-disulfanyl-L-cysteine oxidoreductase SoxD
MKTSHSYRGICLLGASLMAFGGAVASRAQNADKTVWSGVYSQDQAARGKTAYAGACASCHGESMAGIDVAPALVGSNFLNNWNGTSAGDLFDRIKTTMPLNAPGSLDGRTVSDIEAYLLQSNGFPAGQTALPPSQPMMAGIKIVTQKPGS